MTELSKLNKYSLRRRGGDRCERGKALISYRADCDCMKPQDLKCIFKVVYLN